MHSTIRLIPENIQDKIYLLEFLRSNSGADLKQFCHLQFDKKHGAKEGMAGDYDPDDIYYSGNKDIDSFVEIEDIDALDIQNFPC